MGSASARCCSVSRDDSNGKGLASAARARAENSRRQTQITGVKSYKEFQAQYSVKAAVRPRSSAMTVVLRDLNTSQVCRKLKMSEMPCSCMADIVSHCQALSSLEHPHLCKLIEVFEDGSYLYLIYEKASTITLFDHIQERGSLVEEEAADYLRQAAMALCLAHAQGIVHGRLSARSLVLANADEVDEDEECDTQLKICDIGQAYVLRPPLLAAPETEKSLELEQYACSPEYLQNELTPTGYSELPRNADKNDIWALGTIFFHMLTGYPPFEVSSRSELVQAVGRKSVLFEAEVWSKLSKAARDIVEQMLRVSPGIRVSAAALLRHPWIKVARTKFPRRRMILLLSNLRTNVEECEFKRFVLRVIADQLPKDSKTEQVVEQAFRCLDKNGDGVLTVGEVISGLKKHLALAEKNKDLEWLFAQIDRDGSGTINVQEFLSASMDQKRSTSLPVLWEVFNAFDKDRSGHITFDEIGRIVKEVEGQLVSLEQADSISNQIVHELDRSGTGGGIDFDQFVFLMMNSEQAGNPAVTRGCWNVFGVDCHKVRHAEPTVWHISSQRQRANRSVYRRKDSRRRSEAPFIEEPEPDLAG